jgi:arginyl-tRNA synthetase
MSMLHHLDTIVAKEFQRVTGHSVARLSRARFEHGDFQSNAAMEVAAKTGRPALDIAQAVCDGLSRWTQIGSAEVAANGFINIRVADHYLESFALLSHKIFPRESGKTIIIDFGGPNVAKPLHVGHLRSLVIGESLQRIFRALGANVISDAHFGDWGLQMGMLISEIELHDGSLPAQAEELLKLYPEAAAACAADPDRMKLAQEATARLQHDEPNAIRIWKHVTALSKASQEPDFNRLGVKFDLLLGESDVEWAIKPMLAIIGDRAEEDAGALVVRVSEPDDKKEVPPLLLVKSDGSYLYGTTDLATIVERMKLEPDRILYVVDQRQNLHFEQVFRAARKFGFTTKHDGSTTDLVHIGFGTVNDKSGKAYKTREGGVALLSDLLDQSVAKAAERAPTPAAAEKIGVGAVKYADLNTWRISGYKFDLDRMLSFEGKTGPYVQYACVRLRAIFEKTTIPTDWRFRITAPEERALLVACLDFQTRVETAADRYAPNEIAEYAFNLAQEFSRFYTNCPVLGSPEERSRLCLCALTFKILSQCLYLLGIDVPERM